MKKLIIIVAAALYAITGHSATTKYTIKRIGNADGLSNSSVNTIRQDRNTLMWFGTWDGLNLYDSQTIRVFLPSYTGRESIGNNVIRDVVEQNDTCMWIVTDRGIDRYNIKKDRFTNFFYGSKAAGATSENNFHLAVSPTGETVALINGVGKYSYNGRDFVKTASIENRKVTTAFFDNASVLWILTTLGDLYHGDELCAQNVSFVYYDKDSDSIWIQDAGGFHEYGANATAKYTGNPVRACDSDGTFLYLGTSDGVYKMDTRSGSYTQILRNVPVLSVCCGTQQIIWVGTDMQGVWQLSEKLHDFGEISGLFEGNAIRCFAGCGEDRILVGTKGSGLYGFDKSMTPTHHFTTRDGLNHNSVFTLAETRDIVWIGGDGKGLNYIEKGSPDKIRRLVLPDSLGIQSVYSILPQSQDTLWIGTSGNGLFRLVLRADGKPYLLEAAHVPEEELGSNVVYSLLPLGSNHILVGTRGGGVSMVDKRSLLASRRECGPGDDILSMLEDSRGRLWVGSSLGLSCVDSNEGITTYTLSNGLPSQTIHGILEDSAGMIWVSTNSGLARLNADTGYILSFYAIDGLQDNEFSDGASFEKDGIFYFGGIKGFNRFDPLTIQSSAYKPQIRLKELRVDNNVVAPPAGTLELAPDVMSVSFTFTPIDYVSGDRCLMAYKVDGLHKDWIYILESRNVTLSNIEPGRYNLVLSWTDASQSPCEEHWEMPLHFRQAWWKTKIAIALYVLLAIAILSLFIYQWQHNKSIENTHNAKLDFFTNIAHEFSNSLSLIYGPCQELRMSAGITGKDMSRVKSIESNSNRMLTLIQQLINFRKAETGHLKINIGHVDMVALVYNVFDNFREQMSASGISFKLDAPKEGLIWTADGDSMEKIVFNLLSNAAKYTPNGQTVEVKLSRALGKMIMDITNYGVGIPKDKQASIFNRYDVLDRFEKALSKGRTSNGIGLALCQSLVELHHGHIEIISDGTSFTTFQVSLPQLEADDSLPLFSGTAMESSSEEDAEETLEATVSAQEKVKNAEDTVLIVDDDEKIRAFLTEVLSPQFKVVSASDGEEAMKIMADNEPRIVVSDLSMPGMDGLQLRKKMREDKHLGHIPFILLSGKSAVDTQIEALESGVDAYVAKPFHPRHLLARINRLLNRDTEVIEYSQSAQSAVQQFAGKEMKKSDMNMLSAITEIILSHLDEDSLNAEMIAFELSISKIQLYRKLKSTVNMTTTEYIRNVRLEQACHLLKTSNMSVQEVMYACGFMTKTYFYREFQKKYGATPGEFRRSQKS